MQMMSVVAKASRPDRVVASPYDGIRKGSTVMMKIPKPKPVVLSTKLAPTANNAISRRSVTGLSHYPKDTM